MLILRLTDDDYDMYYEIWQRYDPHGTEFINYDKLSDFVNELEEPLGIPKPNKLKLISLNLTICEKNLIHCSDILDALTKNFLGTSNEIEQSINTETIKNDRPATYKPKTNTIEFQRKNYCAKIITRAIKKYTKNKKTIKAKAKTFEKVLIDEL